MKLPLDSKNRIFGIPPVRAFFKRLFDLTVAIIMLPIIAPVTLLLCVIAHKSTGQNGLFRQQRIGLYGQPFTLFKIRSMRPIQSAETNVTTLKDPRITAFGRFLRRSKLDEIPQVFNVIRGDMSFVGPRPDVFETYEYLDCSARKILCVRPGITGPASVLFRNEEKLLGEQDYPEQYNREVIFPAKVKANLAYIENQSLIGDIKIMLRTVLG